MDPFTRDLRNIDSFISDEMRKLQMFKTMKHVIEHLQEMNQQKNNHIHDLQKQLREKDGIITRFNKDINFKRKREAEHFSDDEV